MQIGLGLGIGSPRAPAYLGGLFGPGDVGMLIDPAALGSLSQDDAGSVPVTAAGQPVGLVRDMSGGAVVLSQATASKRPTLQIDGAGRPYLQFDGVDDILATTAFAWGSDAVTMCAAVTNEGDPIVAGVYVAFGGASISAPWYSVVNAGSGGAYGARSRGSTGLVSANSAPYANETAVLTQQSKVSTDTLVMRRNGVQVASAATDQGSGTYGTQPLYVGAGGPATSNPMAGRIYGLVAVNRLLTGPELAFAERWLAHKCGVTL